MSTDERAYMMTIGVPLDKLERDVALEMHYAKRAVTTTNIARLEAELAQQRMILATTDHHIKTLADDWQNLGPNTTLQVTHQTRLDILDGFSSAEIEVKYAEIHKIDPRYIPDATCQNNPRQKHLAV